MADKKNISLLSTTVLPASFVAMAKENNIHVTDDSFIEVTTTTNQNIIQSIQELGNKNIVAVFTSLNAINAIIQFLPSTPSWKIYCINGVSYDKCVEYFSKENILASAPNASSLAEKIIEAKETAVTFFCGSQHLQDLPNALNEVNISADCIEVYSTVLTPKKHDCSQFDAIAFFSPSAVNSFFSNNTLNKNTVTFTIGQTTANAIQQHCNNKIIITQKPGKESLINTVIEYYQTTGVAL